MGKIINLWDYNPENKIIKPKVDLSTVTAIMEIFQDITLSAEHPKDFLDKFVDWYKEQWRMRRENWDMLTSEEKLRITKELDNIETFWESQVPNWDDFQSLEYFQYSLACLINETWKWMKKKKEWVIRDNEIEEYEGWHIITIGKEIAQNDRDDIVWWYANHVKEKISPKQ